MFKVVLDTPLSACCIGADLCSPALYNMDLSVSIGHYVSDIRAGSSNFALFHSGTLVRVISLSAPSELRVIVKSTNSRSDDDYIAVLEDDLRRQSISTIGCDPGTFEYTRAYSAFTAGPSVVVAEVTVVGAVPFVDRVLKSMCNLCQCMVRVRGHSARCNLVDPGSLHATVSRYRRLAWVGDVYHAYDVRAIILARVTEDTSLETAAQPYVSNERMALMYTTLVSRGVQPLYPTLGPSVRQKATAFEASYSGAFRSSYLMIEFNVTPEDVATMLQSIVNGS